MTAPAQTTSITSASSPGAALSPGRERWLLITLAGIQFTHIVDFMIMMPLGPQLTKLFAISDAQFGLLVSAYTFAAGASGLLAATYVDKFGRKRLLLVLYALFALATLACALSPSYATLMLARVACGAFGGVLGTLTQTIVGDVIAFERRGRAMAVVMSSFSMATVAGVPAGLWLATQFNWHVPFYALALVCVLLGLFAWRTLPPLRGHLAMQRQQSSLALLSQTLGDANHRKALLFTALVMFAGFTVIPYITIFTTTNVGVGLEQIPLIYLVGGVATLVTARFFGRLTDSAGKVPVFTWLAALVMVPLLGITLLPRAPLWQVLVVSTLFFVLMSGRMIPSMAIITSAAQPALRGTFMSINGAVQSASMGLASFVSGLIISRDAAGQVQNYWVCGLLGCAATLGSLWLVRHLRLYGSGPGPR
jgi:predicted MFS family arabinose efflux permease